MSGNGQQAHAPWSGPPQSVGGNAASIAATASALHPTASHGPGSRRKTKFGRASMATGPAARATLTRRFASMPAPSIIARSGSYRDCSAKQVHRDGQRAMRHCGVEATPIRNSRPTWGGTSSRSVRQWLAAIWPATHGRGRRVADRPAASHSEDFGHMVKGVVVHVSPPTHPRPRPPPA